MRMAVGVSKTLMLIAVTLLTLCQACSRHVTLRHCPLSRRCCYLLTNTDIGGTERSSCCPRSSSWYWRHLILTQRCLQSPKLLPTPVVLGRQSLDRVRFASNFLPVHEIVSITLK